MRMNQSNEKPANSRNLTKSQQRNITPLKLRNKENIKRDLKTSNNPKRGVIEQAEGKDIKAHSSKNIDLKDAKPYK